MSNKKHVYVLGVLAVLAILVTAMPALAQNTSVNQTNDNGFLDSGGRNVNGMMNRARRGMMRPGVSGAVVAVSGNTITLIGKQGISTSAATTFTVDATNAKIMKNNVAGTIASILVGDTISAQGTVTGTNVVATMIRDGVMNSGPDKTNKTGQKPSTLSAITGNGQPIVAGTVSSISGSTLVITNKSNVSYTIDATNAKFAGSPNITSISNVNVGDMVIVQGAVNGNNIIASSVIDQTRPVSTTTGQSHKGGFFSSVGSFFAHLFGY